MSERDPDKQTQDEVREEAAAEPDDPITRREKLEVELMDDGVSDAGEDIGQTTP